MSERRMDRPPTAFEQRGLKGTIDLLVREIAELYLADHLPWVVGYSGGKDSTAVLQLVWLAISYLQPEQRSKPVHVISTDTLVENPIVASWVTNSLVTMESAARSQGLPITSHRLTPALTDTFWVNLIGKGYPAPRPKFRWCTERLKIKPSNAFITRVVRENGEAIVVLGTRKAESSVRGHRMGELEKRRVRDRLSPNASLPNSLVYTPIENWSNDDVWLFLMQIPNPWGYDNKSLLTMYQGASPDGECPLVVDSSTPSCGDSRFGCWVCTLVDRDKSMHAMIQNDQEKEWMLPLLELRNELDVVDDHHLRDFRRMSGDVQLFHDKPIPGPYVQAAREHWLRKVLEAQKWAREHGPASVREIELISLEELHEIRRIWVLDKHELEDTLPRIYQEAMGTPFPTRSLEEGLMFNHEDMKVLQEVVGDDRLQFELARELLGIARRFRTKVHRAGLYEALERTIRKGFYENESDATQRARKRRDALNASEKQAAEQLPLLPEIRPVEAAAEHDS